MLLAQHVHCTLCGAAFPPQSASGHRCGEARSLLSIGERVPPHAAVRSFSAGEWDDFTTRLVRYLDWVVNKRGGSWYSDSDTVIWGDGGSTASDEITRIAERCGPLD